MSTIDKTKWIDSAGGPLVLLQASSLKVWHGVFGADYDDACAIAGYTGVLRRERHDVLVLGADPMPTAHFKDAEELFLVRLYTGPGDEAVIESIATMRGALNKAIEEVDLEIVEGNQTIIDSGADGQNADERFELSIPPGKYRVLTFDYDPSSEISLIVHQFIRS